MATSLCQQTNFPWKYSKYAPHLSHPPGRRPVAARDGVPLHRARHDGAAHLQREPHNRLRLEEEDELSLFRLRGALDKTWQGPLFFFRPSQRLLRPSGVQAGKKKKQNGKILSVGFRSISQDDYSYLGGLFIWNFL